MTKGLFGNSLLILFLLLLILFLFSSSFFPSSASFSSPSSSFSSSSFSSFSFSSFSSSSQFALAPADLNLTEFKLDFYRIVCSHEHYVILNLPLGAQLYPMGTGSQSSSPTGSISSTYDDLGMPNMDAMGDLSQEFRHYHYLSGLVLSELSGVLEGKHLDHMKMWV